MVKVVTRHNGEDVSAIEAEKGLTSIGIMGATGSAMYRLDPAQDSIIVVDVVFPVDPEDPKATPVKDINVKDAKIPENQNETLVDQRVRLDRESGEDKDVPRGPRSSDPPVTGKADIPTVATYDKKEDEKASSKK